MICSTYAHIFLCVPDSKNQQLALCVFSSTKASCTGAQVCIILMNILRLVRLAPGCALCHNLMGGWMMRWKPSHGGYEPGFPGSMLPAVVLRGGLGWSCIFFRELRVSAVWILQTVAEGINRLSVSSTPHPPTRLFFRDGPLHRSGSATDVCLCYASIYLFGKQMHY